MKVKYLILGAGPAGLTLANRLADNGIEDFAVIEKNQEAGGLCRSMMVDKSELDIGGGHFLDVRRPEVVEYMFKFMPADEWNVFDRDSRIYIHNVYIGHPFEANIWQLDECRREKYLESIKTAGCNNSVKKPEKFTEWIRWKLGDEIAENYMLPYNRKMYGEELDELGTYWLEKLPNVSYEETLMSCRMNKAFGSQPGHARFYYPKKYGFGEVFRRMADRIEKHIVYNEPVHSIDLDKRTVNDKYEAQYIITTIPWTDVRDISGLESGTLESIKLLKHTGINVDYFADRMDTQAQWIYYPDEKLAYHRILVRHNFLPGSLGYWTETNSERRKKLGFDSQYTYYNEYAYPLNTIGKNEIMQRLLCEAGKKSVIGLGRWGEWQHYNADLVIEKALRLADDLSKMNNIKH